MVSLQQFLAFVCVAFIAVSAVPLSEIRADVGVRAGNDTSTEMPTMATETNPATEEVNTATEEIVTGTAETEEPNTATEPEPTGTATEPAEPTGTTDAGAASTRSFSLTLFAILSLLYAVL